MNSRGTASARGFESFMVLGSAIYLICNNTRESMEMIAKNPRWLTAQVPFAELSEQVRAHPLAVVGDNTSSSRKFERGSLNRN